MYLVALSPELKRLALSKLNLTGVNAKLEQAFEEALPSACAGQVFGTKMIRRNGGKQ
jgi:hypothetical protein